MAKPADQQPSDPTIELSDSQLVPVGTKAKQAKAKAAKAQQDVSLWRGEVVASSDFVPARARKGVRLWLLLLLFGAIGVAGGVVALKIMKDPEPEPVVEPAAVTPAPAVAPTPAVTPTPEPAVTPTPTPAPTPTPTPPAVEDKPPAVKAAVTPTKKIVKKKKKKKPVKRKVTRKKSSAK